MRSGRFWNQSELKIKGVLLAEIFEIEILEFLNRMGSKATSVSFCQMTALECFADAFDALD